MIRKMMFQAVAAVCFVILAASAATAARPDQTILDESLDSLLDRIEDNFSRVRSLKTMIEQEKTIPVFSEKMISKGFCIFERPDRLRLEFTEPFKSVLIVNGSSVTKYEYFDGKWQKLAPGGAQILLMITGNISSWLQGRFRDPKLYEISAVENERIIVRLIPKSTEFRRFVSSFELGLNSDLDGLDFIVINEHKEAFTRINFFNDVKNTRIPEDVFQGGDDAPSQIVPW